MNKPQKYFLSFIILVIVTGKAFSQNDSPIQLGADIMSRYIWRGIDLGGQSPSIQPSLKIVLNSKDTIHSLIIGAWGAYNINTSNQEADLYLTYTYKNIVSFTFTDYYFPGLFNDSLNSSKYFNYNKNTTGHVFETAISFNGTDKIPFTLMFAMNIYGADARKMNEDGTPGNIFMSKYIEAGYKKTIKGVDFNAFIGAALDDPDEKKGELGYFGSNKSADVINLGVKAAKKIKVTNDYSLPVQASAIINPESGKIFIVFGISF